MKNSKDDAHFLQYADDTNVYHHCKPNQIDETISKAISTIESLYNWSSNNNLVFNETKTKLMIFSTPQMSTRHKLSSLYNEINIFNNTVKINRTSSMKILGVTFEENCSWDKHINETIKSCCATLSTLRKLKRFTPYHLRKSLCESLVLSKIDYCNTVYYPLTLQQTKRLLKIQNAAASFVKKRFSSITDVLDLKWLPVKEHSALSIAKLFINLFITGTSHHT